jgi:hypothetical protein
MARRPVLAAVLLTVLALAAGCGGDNDDGGNDPTAWANDLCSAITTWQNALGDSVRSIGTAGLSRASLQSAADDARDSTDAFIDEVTGLGAPDTQAGAEAKDTVDEFAADLREGVDDVEGALESSTTIAGAITEVTNTLTTMGNQLTSTLTQLGQLDAQGELEQAFRDADSCDSLVR